MNMFMDVVIGVAQKGLENQVVKPEDFYDENGFLICGVCGEPRQRIQKFKDPTPDDPEHEFPLKVVAECRCDRERKAEEKRREELARDMAIVQTLKKESLIDEKFKNATFDNFVSTKENAKNLKLCKRYASAFDEMVKKSQGLLMWGNVGTGKSFAAACIANALLEKKVPVIMTSFVKLLELIQKDKDEEEAFIYKMGRAKLVIFDDLGAERNTDYALEKVYNVIDSRYRSGLPMILTTNLTMNEMMDECDIRYSRIYDRIFEVCYPMQFTGVSWRKKTANKRFDAVGRFLLGEDETEE